MTAVGVRLARVSLELDGRRVLHALDFELAPGARWLLLGANGAGKTQFLKLLAGERWPTPGPGAVREYRDERGRPLDLPALKPRLVLVGGERQDRYLRHDWNFTVRRVVGTGCRGTDRPLAPLRPADRARVRGLLRRFGLEGLAHRRFLTLSYGERRLTLLARALAGRPPLLLLDEPFNGLDARARRVVTTELRRLARTRTTIVVSAHRPDDVPRAFDSTLVLEAGRIAWAGPRAGAPGPWLARRAAGGPAAARPRARDATAADAAGTPLLRVRGATLHRDYRPVVVDLDWTIAPGEHWALVGANGSGKSTLLRFVHGELPAALGAVVERRGHPPGTHVERWRRRLGFVSPELQAEYLDPVTAEELVVSGLRATVGLDRTPTAAERRRAHAALARVGWDAPPGRPFRDLSYGQRRLALLARALVREPEALLLDEPLTGLDAPSRSRLRALLSRLAREGVQLVMAVHHADDLVPEVDRVLELADGRARARRRRSR